MSFTRIQALIESDQLLALGEVLKDLTPDERKRCAADLVAYEKKHRASGRSWHHHDALAIAGAGLLPTASALTPWLVRYRLSKGYRGAENGLAIATDVLRRRDPAWLPDLAARIAARMPSRQLWRDDLLHFVLEFCGEDPPDDDGFLLHLLAYSAHDRWRPGFDVLFPRLLHVPGAGAFFGDARSVQAFLCARMDRRLLLDGCLARLQQGGPQNEVTGFLELHAAIGVTLDETVEHVRDYVAMLPDSRSTVAGLAQQQLKRVDEAGKLDFDLLAEASRWVFGRTEKKLVRTQLAWLGKHVKAHPDEVVLLAAELFAHESDDLRGQAVKLIVKHANEISATTRAELLGLAEQLPADLAAQFGAETAAEEAPALAPYAPTPFPDPIATLDELTGEVHALFGRNSGQLDAVTGERIIEAVVRFAWQDREAVARAFTPLYEKYPWVQHRSAYDNVPDLARQHSWSIFISIIAAVSTPVAPLGPIDTILNAARTWARQLRRAEEGSVSHQLATRLHEIARGLTGSPRPALVSTPTETSGLLDAATLLDRLAKAEADGWEPWPRDLRHAYYRLPRDTRPEDFASLESSSARLLREWLADMEDPVAELVERRRSSPKVESRLLVTLEPGLPAPEHHWYGHNEWGAMIEWWPAVLPVQREVVAAHLVPHLAHRLESKGGDGALLPMLAEAHGPIGVATHLAFAYGLGAEATVGRAHAVDALLILAARGQFDGKALGELVGLLVERGDLPLNRVVPALRDVARSGAAPQVWDLVAVALPKAWSHNRVADLVELAVELAQQLKPGGEIGGLAEVAARKGSSKAVVQARRLVSALS
ncbi:DUF6493 family protein [Lentzea sp. NPDC003310]|uniref:DUF6493 family protein n=1 Tax=Lentzea sp. NPDC003310 TaxID=3154447 RepID=UPI00339F1BAD